MIKRSKSYLEGNKQVKVTVTNLRLFSLKNNLQERKMSNHTIRYRLILWVCMIFLVARLSPAQAPPSVAGSSEQDTLLPSSLPEDTLRQALETLKRYYQDDRFWRYDQKNLRHSIGDLIRYFESPPIDTTVSYLNKYPFPSLLDTSIYRIREDSLILKIHKLTVLDTILLPEKSYDSLFFGADTSALLFTDSLFSTLPDSLLRRIPEDVPLFIIRQDTLLKMAKYPPPPVLEESPLIYVTYGGDTTVIPVTDMDYLIASDSLKQAVNRLLLKTQEDSTRLCFNNLSNNSICVWLKNNNRDFHRFWLKNEYNDSIGIWIQNIARNEVRLTVDNNVFFHRIDKYKKKETFLIPENEEAGTTLHAVKPVVIKVRPWKFGGIGSINLTEGIISNWAEGGENSISTLVLLNSFANYKKNKHQWNNTFRFKYGLLKSGKSKGLRKNEDSWEIDSRYGLKASKKWYYSAAFNLKSQIANGFKYPNDSVVISKFFAPGYLHLSIGMDFRPNKKISVLVSPLTWKSTFVLDTVTVDQTRFGLTASQRARNDIGAYIKTYVRYDFSKTMYMTHRINLFSQYNRNPQNIDVDWEMAFIIKLGPFFNINLYTHMIYDDNIKLPVYDSEGKPVLGPDGKQKRSPGLQFKQYLNIGFRYKF